MHSTEATDLKQLPLKSVYEVFMCCCNNNTVISLSSTVCWNITENLQSYSNSLVTTVVCKKKIGFHDRTLVLDVADKLKTVFPKGCSVFKSYLNCNSTTVT